MSTDRPHDLLSPAIDDLRIGAQTSIAVDGALPSAPGCEAPVYARVFSFDVGGMGMGETGEAVELSLTPFTFDHTQRFDYPPAHGPSAEHVLVAAEDNRIALILSREGYLRSGGAWCSGGLGEDRDDTSGCAAVGGSTSCELVHVDGCTGRVVRTCRERSADQKERVRSHTVVTTLF